MALVVADRVREQTTSTGTGTYTLAGAVLGHQSFSVVGDGSTTYYCCTDGTDWEIGTGTYTASGTTLARTTVHASTNGGSAVDWSAGTRNIYGVLPATVLDSLINPTGAGDVVGPASSTDNAVARFDTTTGKLIQDSVVVVDDSGNLSGVSGAVFNDAAADVNFRVETLLDENALFVDGGTDNVGIGTASPDKKLEVVGTIKANLEPDGDVDGVWFVGEHDNSAAALELRAKFAGVNHHYCSIYALGSTNTGSTFSSGRGKALLLECDTRIDTATNQDVNAAFCVNVHNNGVSLASTTLAGIYNNGVEAFAVLPTGIRTSGTLSVGTGNTLGDNDGLSLTATAATEVLGSFIAHASQTANLTEWKSSGGTVGAHVTASQEFHNTGGGTNSCIYGSGAGVDGDEPRCTSIGVDAVSYGDDSVAVGYGATAGGNGSTAYQDNVAIGSGAMSVISSGVAIGAGATTGSSSGSTAIGASANVSGNSSVAIGAGSVVSGAFGVAIGQGVTSTGSGVTIGRGAAGSNAIGYNADSSGHTQAQAWGTSCTAGALGSVAMGYAADSSHSGSICIGNRATSTAAYQLVIGSDYLSGAVKIDNVYIGEGVTSASPDGVTINSTGGEGTDIAGSDITIAGGKGTGSAVGGEVKFATSAPGATGTTLRSLTEKLRIGYDGTTLVAQTNTPSTPASGECVVYMKGSLYIIAYDDSGTVRYKYLDLSGTGTTWTHTTTAP